MYGGCKNFKGDHKACGPGNVILFPGIDSRSVSSKGCETSDSADYAYNSYVGNTCVLSEGRFYSFAGAPPDVPFTAANRFISPNASFDCHCGANFTGPDSLRALQRVPREDKPAKRAKLDSGPPRAAPSF